jgi:AraC-like DNA-binding protein
MHGGATPSGLSAPGLKHGRYSKYIPVRLQQQYENAENDPRLIELRSELALIDARLADLLKQVSNSEAGELWNRLKEAKQAYVRCKDEEKGESLGTILWLIDEGYAEWMSWVEIRQTIESRRKLADTERERIVKAEQMMPAKEAHGLVMAVIRSVRSHVTDRDALQRISDDLASLVGTHAG